MIRRFARPFQVPRLFGESKSAAAQCLETVDLDLPDPRHVSEELNRLYRLSAQENRHVELLLVQPEWFLALKHCEFMYVATGVHGPTFLGARLMPACWATGARVVHSQNDELSWYLSEVKR